MEEPRVDLETTTWCDSSGLVAVACVVQYLMEHEGEAQVIAPANSEISHYIARMRLGSVLSALGAKHNIPYVREHAASSLVELTEFDGAAGATALANMAYDHAYEQDPIAADALLAGLGETAENVHEHSGRVSGFAAAQRYRDGRLNFAVGDSGIGLLGSLRAVGVRTDEQAVQVALLRGGTGSGDVGRGHGLPSVREQVCELGGVLTVVSGGAMLSARAFRAASLRALPVQFPGTLIAGVIPRRVGTRPRRSPNESV